VIDLRLKILNLHNKPSREKKAEEWQLEKRGGGMANRGMGAALKKGGMSKMKKKRKK
jgi:hypothetical protein